MTANKNPRNGWNSNPLQGNVDFTKVQNSSDTSNDFDAFVQEEQERLRQEDEARESSSVLWGTNSTATAKTAEAGRGEASKVVTDIFKAVADDANQHAASCGPFINKPMNEWIEEAHSKPVPKQLFDEFWLEGQLAILFAPTGAGKTILAMQIADGIANGRSAGNGFGYDAGRHRVAYFDFELSPKQVEKRYSNDYSNHYRFSDDFYRLELNPDSAIDGADVVEQIGIYAENNNFDVVIVDNITYLTNQGTEKSRDAMPLMQALMRLKKEKGLSILVLAHTPKRDTSTPLTLNDLQGSSMLSNFSDAVFTIGRSKKDKALRYIKQLKQRDEVVRYTEENVVVCQLQKDGNFTRFVFEGQSDEREHLNENERKRKVTGDIASKAMQLYKSGKSQREIASELDISVGSVSNILRGTQHNDSDSDHCPF